MTLIWVCISFTDKGFSLWDNISMEHIGENLKVTEKNIELVTSDPVVQGGFTQIPNFILRSPEIGIGAKVVYAMFLSYAWNNDHCFPRQDKLSKDIGMSIGRVNQFIKELESLDLIVVTKRGQGKTNLYKIKFTVKKNS